MPGCGFVFSILNSAMELAGSARGVSSVPLPATGRDPGGPLLGSFRSSPFCGGWRLRRRRNDGLVVRASAEKSDEESMTRTAFLPFEELKKESFLAPISPQHSLGRQAFSDECEAAINEQIK